LKEQSPKSTCLTQALFQATLPNEHRSSPSNSSTDKKYFYNAKNGINSQTHKPTG